MSTSTLSSVTLRIASPSKDRERDRERGRERKRERDRKKTQARERGRYRCLVSRTWNNTHWDVVMTYSYMWHDEQEEEPSLRVPTAHIRCVATYICIRMHLYITHKYKYGHTFIWTHGHTYTYVCPCMYTYMYIHKYICLGIFTCMCVHACVYIDTYA